MVSTRQMATSSGAIANVMAPTIEEVNYLRPSVVTRQSQTIQANVVTPHAISSSSLLSDGLASSSNAIALSASAGASAATVGFEKPITTTANSLRQTQAFKSDTTIAAANTTCVIGSSSQLMTMGTQPHHHHQQQQQQQQRRQEINQNPNEPLNLLDLPVEIMYKILSYVGFKKVAQLRVISHKMNDVCMHILNSTFSKLITRTFNRFQAIKSSMPRRESARRNHPLACECDIIETCYMRLSLLQMTFGKHIERGHCCFFPGAILDEVYTILYFIKNAPCVERPYRVTDELFDLSTMAMEYFRDRIEKTLPDIAYFNKDFFKLPTTTKRPLVIASDLSDSSSSLPSPPQSNMVLRKGIRKIKQGMKIYNNQLSVLRNELRTCKRKSVEQGKQIAEQQKLLAEQRKQTLEYANRLDENDKKNEEMSRKFSTLLQELNKCKTELQYWRSKSPAIPPTCTSCGHKVPSALPAEDFQALVNQGVKPEDIILNMDDDTDAESDASMNDSGCNTMSSLCSNQFVFPDETTTAKLLAVNTASKNLKRQYNSALCVGGGGVNAATSNYAKVVDNGRQLRECTANDDSDECGPSAFISAAGYSTRLFYGSSLASGAAASSADAMATTASSSTSLRMPGNESQHKSVIVSPQSQRMNAIKIVEQSALNKAEQETTTTSTMRSDNVVGAGGEQEIASNNIVEDVSSLIAITSHETKKARRVQKTARCLTNSSGKRK